MDGIFIVMILSIFAIERLSVVMKKICYPVVLCVTLALMLLCSSCAEAPMGEIKANNQNALVDGQTTLADEQSTQIELWPTTPEGYLAYPVTTAVSVKDQKATDWTKNYLKKHKATFDLVAQEVLALGDWGINNYGDGFSPNPTIPNQEWAALSQSTQSGLETIDADFREEFGEDIIVGVTCVNVAKNEGRKSFNFFFEESDIPLSLLLSYFSEGYAGFRNDTPYVGFGDGWYFYCGDWG